MSSDDDMVRRMNTMFRGQRDQASAAEMAAVRSWQEPDGRFYGRVQAALRDPSQRVDPETQSVIDHLDSIMSKGETTEDLDVIRGIRSLTNTFGVEALDLDRLVEALVPVNGFLATSVSRAALDEFVVPEGHGGAAQLLLVAPAGLPAIWVPPLGASHMAYQRELLFGPGHRILIESYDGSAGLPTIVGRLIR